MTTLDTLFPVSRVGAAIFKTGVYWNLLALTKEKKSKILFAFARQESFMLNSV
jgi:hypothetical protein